MPRPDVVVRYGADMRQHDTALKGMQSQIRTLTSLAGAFGASLSAVGLASFTRQTLAWGDSMAKTADKIGIGTEALQEFQYAARRTAGVTNEAANTSLQRFSRRVGEAAAGVGVLKKEFERYNIAVRDSTGAMRPLQDILGDYADAIQGAESQQEKLRLSVAAFDIEGAALVNTLDDGSAGLNRMATEARDLGLVMEDDLVRTAEQLNDEFDKLTEKLDMTLKKAVLGFTRDVQVAAEWMAAYQAGQISFWEWFSSGPDHARERLAKLQEQMGFLDEQPQGLVITIDKARGKIEKTSRAVGELKDRWDYLLDIYEQQDRDTQIQWARQQAGIAKTTGAIKEQAKAVEDVKEKSTELDWAFQSAFESAILEGGKLSDVLKGLAKDIAAVFIRQSITAPLASAAGGFLSSIFGGFFASGGIAPANKLSVVGENGPEFIMPSRDTAVVPAGMGGVTVTNHWDFSGANPATVQLLRQEASRIVEASKASVLQAIEQGGGYARSVGRRT